MLRSLEQASSILIPDSDRGLIDPLMAELSVLYLVNIVPSHGAIAFIADGIQMEGVNPDDPDLHFLHMLIYSQRAALAIKKIPSSLLESTFSAFLKRAYSINNRSALGRPGSLRTTLRSNCSFA